MSESNEPTPEAMIIDVLSMVEHHREVEGVNAMMTAQLATLIERNGGGPITFNRAELDRVRDDDGVVLSSSSDGDTVTIELISPEEAARRAKEWDTEAAVTHAAAQAAEEGAVH